jgi:predicted P-loop ATPase
MTDHDAPTSIVREYFNHKFHVVFWPERGAQKGPTEDGWKTRSFTLEDFKPQTRVGLVTGQEIEPGRYLHDVDIDWSPGYRLALNFLPKTEFVYGRASKHVSHCFYTLPEPLPRITFMDPVDKQTLIEIRGTKENGELGWQSMVPPSIWSDDAGHREPLEFRHPSGRFGTPSFFENTQHFKQRVCLAAIAMLLAKHFGQNGFGHDVRLAWAGFLLRASVPPEDLVLMGEAISLYCNNREIIDVRKVVISTEASLANDAKKVRGGPALAKLLGGEAGKKIVSQINQWLGRDSDYVRNQDGLIIKDHQENIRRALRIMNVELSYNEFAEKGLIKDQEDLPPRMLDDRMMNNLWLKVDRDQRFRPNSEFFEKVVSDLTYENSFHPVRDYLSKLVWDNEPRINRWLTTYGGAEETADGSETQTYLEAVSAIVLIAAVRRIMHPGCKYDEMLVLESEQGLNKSSALRALCPYDEWFSDDLPLNCDAKEIIERTLGKWIIEASDLVGGRKADRDHLKSMLSRQIDGPARMAYARKPVERARQFIIVGTTNSASYLEDMTGARRFWPVRVQKFDVVGIARDRDQLWAEARVREASGESVRLPEELWVSAGEHQEQRRELDAWEEVLRLHLEGLVANPTGRVQATAESLWAATNVPLERRDRMAARRLSEIMQRFGFVRTNVRDGSRVMTGYVKDNVVGGNYDRTPEKVDM